MKNLTLDSSPIKIVESDILDFENRHEIILPDYLKSFFLKYNGTRTKECLYIRGVSYVINSFLPLLKNRNASVELILPAVRDEAEGIGRNDLIPFATDPGGRPYYVSVGSKDYGVVYYDIVGLGFQEPLRKIAESFEEFLNGLFPEET